MFLDAFETLISAAFFFCTLPEGAGGIDILGLDVAPETLTLNTNFAGVQTFHPMFSMSAENPIKNHNCQILARGHQV